MGLVYPNAACNITATCAVGGDGGCFSHGNLDMVKRHFITLDLTINGSSTYQIPDSSLYGQDIVEAPLNSLG
ncbi:hypothetical protein F5B21DRAFT_497558 [Xylaria acuta]|nr:hypothetical protein F5B21DRAFT_497558 [Xylaria acuta]